MPVDNEALEHNIPVEFGFLWSLDQTCVVIRHRNNAQRLSGPVLGGAREDGSQKINDRIWLNLTHSPKNWYHQNYVQFSWKRHGFFKDL